VAVRHPWLTSWLHSKAFTKHNREYTVALRSTQIASLIKSEKSMLYFSLLLSSTQGAEATSHIRETLCEKLGL